MDHHRFRDSLEPTYLPRPQAQAVSPGAFMACPFLGAGGSWQQNLYQLALQHAQAVHQPSLPERLMSAGVN